jgi:hypothetical protein
LPQLRAAARLATQTLSNEATAVSTLLRSRGDSLYQLDPGGRVPSTEAFHVFDRADYPISVIGRRLRSRDASAQPALDRAVALAVTRPGDNTRRPREVRKKLRFSVKLQQLAGASEGRSVRIFACRRQGEFCAKGVQNSSEYFLIKLTSSSRVTPKASPFFRQDRAQKE